MGFTDTILVLNKGYVRLIDKMGSDLSIVRAARVSYAADWRTGEDGDKDEKLIGYLMRNNHTSPFESVTFTFEVKAPLFVFRQWHRHRTWSYNEISARYTELEEDYYVPDPAAIGQQSKNNKQCRDIVDGNEQEKVSATIELACERAFRDYERLLGAECPRELARLVLPLASYSRMFATVDLHNLFHFLRLRLHPHAQWEIRQYAWAILTLIKEVCPVAVKAFQEGLTYE